VHFEPLIPNYRPPFREVEKFLFYSFISGGYMENIGFDSKSVFEQDSPWNPEAKDLNVCFY